MAMKMENVTGAKLVHNGTTYNMVEAKFNGTIVWPLSVTVSYRVTSANLVFYRNGQEIYTYDYIPADGSVYAKVFGDVDVYENNVKKRTLEWVQLDVRISSGTNLYVSDNEIHGPDWATAESSSQSASVMASYETSMAVSAGTITQEANVKSASGSPVYGEKDYDYEHQQRSDPYGYHVELTAGNYSSPSAAASAGAHTTSLSVSNAYHWEDVSTPYTQTVTQNYTYTARPGQTFPEPTTISDTEVAPERVSDSVTPEKVSGDSAITLSGLTVTIPSRGIVPGDARSATFRATNGTASADVTIYQQLNRIESTSDVYDLSVDIDVTGDISALGGLLSVDYVSYVTTTNVYSSGDREELAREPLTAAVSTSPDSIADTNSVSGSGSFAISVPQNDTGLARSIYVSLTANGQTASDSAIQEAASTTPTAEVYANIATNGAPKLRLKMTAGSVNFPVTLTGVYYHYILTGTTDEVSIMCRRDVTVEANDTDTNIVGPPLFSNGETGVHWFSASSVSQIGIANTTFPRKNFVAPYAPTPDV